MKIKRLLFTGLFLLGCGFVPRLGRAADPIRLIVMVDDVGAAHGMNEGTVRAHRDGIVTDTNIIVPGPWFPQVVEMARENPNLGFGVHLALTSEWKNIKWRPITYPKTLVDADGFFFPGVWPPKNGATGNTLKEANPDLGEIERELRAQIETARRRIPRVSYLWMHMGFTSYSKDVAALTKRLAEEYKMPDFGEAKDALGIRGVQQIKLTPEESAGLDRAGKLALQLSRIEPGTWLLGGHLGIDSPEMRAIGDGRNGGEAEERAALAAVYSDPRVKKVVETRCMQLIPVSVVVREYLAAKTN